MKAVKISLRQCRYIRSLGLKASVSIKPGTPVSDIESLLPEADMVLVMSVEPGFGGQKFIPETLGHIRELANLREQHNYNYDIEIDGGINLDNVADAVRAGVNVIGCRFGNFRDVGYRKSGKRIPGKGYNLRLIHKIMLMCSKSH